MRIRNDEWPPKWTPQDELDVAMLQEAVTLLNGADDIVSKEIVIDSPVTGAESDLVLFGVVELSRREVEARGEQPGNLPLLSPVATLKEFELHVAYARAQVARAFIQDPS